VPKHHGPVRETLACGRVDVEMDQRPMWTRIERQKEKCDGCATASLLLSEKPIKSTLNNEGVSDEKLDCAGAPTCGWCKRGNQNQQQALGRSRGGFSTKIHLCTNPKATR